MLSQVQVESHPVWLGPSRNHGGAGTYLPTATNGEIYVFCCRRGHLWIVEDHFLFVFSVCLSVFVFLCCCLSDVELVKLQLKWAVLYYLHVVHNAAFNPLFLSVRASAFVGWCWANVTDTIQIAFISRLPFCNVAPPSHLVQNSGKGLQHPLKHCLRCYGNESCIAPWRFFLQWIIRYHTPTLHWICKCICASWVSHWAFPEQTDGHYCPKGHWKVNPEIIFNISVMCLAQNAFKQHLLPPSTCLLKQKSSCHIR